MSRLFTLFGMSIYPLKQLAVHDSVFPTYLPIVQLHEPKQTLASDAAQHLTVKMREIIGFIRLLPRLILITPEMIPFLPFFFIGLFRVSISFFNRRRKKDDFYRQQPIQQLLETGIHFSCLWKQLL